MDTKTFSTRSNARRAAIKAGVPMDEVEIVAQGKGDDVRFSWKRREQATAARKTTGVLTDQFVSAIKKDAPKTRAKVKRDVEAKRREQLAAKQAAAPAEREVRNGVKRPLPGSKCGAVWAWLDKHPGSTVKDVREWAEGERQNVNNASIEYYQHRKFHANTA